MVTLESPVESVPKINRRIVPALKRLGIKTIRDLLFHFPLRYEDFSNQKKIRNVAVGEIVTIQGMIAKIASRRTARKHMTLTEAVITDETGRINAIWFNQPFLLRNLHQGNAIRLSGKVIRGPHGICLQNPAHEKTTRREGIHTGGLVAIYPETRGITSRWLRFLIHSFINLRAALPDPLPQETRKRYQLWEIRDAIRAIHFPQTLQETTSAQQRFNFEELLLIQLRMLRERLKLKQEQAPRIPFDLPLVKQFVQSLPFPLTNAQRRSLWEIVQDLAKSTPMNRLLEGDVGSGKTVVAAGAALLAVKTRYRALFMAPTEILARQHFETLHRLLGPFAINVGLLLGAEKRVAHNPEIIVGTHALLQKHAKFENVGLVVIDEQHRFGVEQRAALLNKREEKMRDGKKQNLIPHFLSMSATPIPRTLALALYGDLDLSILDEMPQSRRPVITRIIAPQKRNEAYQFIRDEVKGGRQVFVVCPRIEANRESQSANRNHMRFARGDLQNQQGWDDVKSVKAEYKKLSEDIFPNFRITMLHGKMSAKGGSAPGGKSKEQIMKDFRAGEIDILVATSVIEVGIDVPNATIMMIEGAERFGLAQLHQFRGRVGRAEAQSYCFLFPTEDGLITKRLRAVTEAKNGFELAEKDLAIRGPGEFFGTRQSGLSDAALAALTDTKLIREVRQEAAKLITQSTDLSRYPILQKRLIENENAVHFE